MAAEQGFTGADATLGEVLAELQPREPIFHTAAFGRTPAELERAMAPGYWEVGASGRRYSREFILRMFVEDPPVDAAEEGWHCAEFGLRRLAAETYLLTYTLSQGDRRTRRTTIWQRTDEGWRVLFHQGTVITAPGDDVMPQIS